MVPMTPTANNRTCRGLVRAATMLTVSAILVLIGCQKRQGAETDGQGAVPKVSVVRAEKRDVPITTEGIGTTRALQEVTIRARVAGFLQQEPKELFQEGKDVTKDQLLLVIDEKPFQATVNAATAKVEETQARKDAAENSKAVDIAKARLDVSKAALEFAKVQLNRSQVLYQRNAITREERDEKQTETSSATADVAAKTADRDQAIVDFDSNKLLTKANLDAAKAELDKAQLDLDYCKMTSPIDGRIGELQVKLGNYVSGGINGTPLITIQQLDPMGVDFQISSRYLPLVQKLADKGLKVNLVVQGDRPFPNQAEVFFVDNRVDPSTSTFLARAKVANPEKSLLPGDYVKTHSIIGTYKGVVVVPEQAVIETQAGSVVYAVEGAGKDQKVKSVEVKPIDLFEGLRVLTAGLEPGTPVIVEGLQLVRPGQTVQTEVQSLDSYLRPTPTAETTGPVRLAPPGTEVEFGNAPAAQPAAPKTKGEAPPPRSPASPHHHPAPVDPALSHQSSAVSHPPFAISDPP